MMQDLSEIFLSVKKAIKEQIESRSFLYNSSSVREWLANIKATDQDVLKQEILDEVSVGDHEFSHEKWLYIQILLWRMADFDKKFVSQMAQSFLFDPEIKNKEPWVSMLQDLDELATIASFFIRNPEYGDKYFQERQLLILSETNLSLGDKILYFLDSSEEILCLAALIVMESQKLKEYTPQIIDLFKRSEDTDIIKESAGIISKWQNDTGQLIANKITDLQKCNEEYYAETIEELQETIDRRKDD